MSGIRRSVGVSGANDREDVKIIRRLLNRRRITGATALAVDGIAGPLTTKALRRFQKDRRGAAAASRARSVAAPDDARLSGARWWHANQARYPSSSDLASPFWENVTSFIAALCAAGTTVRISVTFRHPIRAKLMPYSYKVRYGQIAPDAVPAIAGCDTEWNDGDPRTSKIAAGEVIRLFGIVHEPAISSNHGRGTAIDINVTRPAMMSIADGAGKQVTVKSAAELNRVGPTYGVHKLVADPPRWSANGH